MKSRSSLWNRICEGLRDIADSSVLRYCITAFAILSLLMDPLLNVLSQIIRLAVLMDDCGDEINGSLD